RRVMELTAERDAARETVEAFGAKITALAAERDEATSRLENIESDIGILSVKVREVESECDAARAAAAWFRDGLEEIAKLDARYSNAPWIARSFLDKEPS